MKCHNRAFYASVSAVQIDVVLNDNNNDSGKNCKVLGPGVSRYFDYKTSIYKRSSNIFEVQLNIVGNRKLIFDIN